jgi:hypothetical protein
VSAKRRTGQYLDRLAGEVRQTLRPQYVVVTDDPLRHAADRGRELQGLVAQRHRGGKVHPAGQRQIIEFVGVGGLDEFRLEALAVGKGGDQVMLVAAGGVPFALEKGRRFADRHDQRTVRLGRIDAGAGREAGQYQTADQAKQLRQRFSPVSAVTDGRFAGIIRASRRGGRVVECT